jgi:hypothetical protein
LPDGTQQANVRPSIKAFGNGVHVTEAARRMQPRTTVSEQLVDFAARGRAQRSGAAGTACARAALQQQPHGAEVLAGSSSGREGRVRRVPRTDSLDVDTRVQQPHDGGFVAGRTLFLQGQCGARSAQQRRDSIAPGVA